MQRGDGDSGGELPLQELLTVLAGVTAADRSEVAEDLRRLSRNNIPAPPLAGAGGAADVDQNGRVSFPSPFDIGLYRARILTRTGRECK